MSNDPCKVALVIPVHNRRETTLQCLRSLGRIDRTGLDIKIYIVDDGSKDGTAEAIGLAFPDAVLIAGDGSLHYAGGTNRGISEALKWQPEYVVLMNDDAVFHEQFLQRLLHTARANPRSVVGALLLLWNEPHRAFQVALKWNTWKGGWQIRTDLTAFQFSGTALGVECLVGNCVLLPVEAIGECGLLDEKGFPFGWGDVQYFMRVRKHGWRLLLDPTAYVWCEPNTYPQPLHHLSLNEIFEVLFRNQRHPANLKRQLCALRESAPNKLAGTMAFVTYCLGLLIKTAKFGSASLVSTGGTSDKRTNA